MLHRAALVLVLLAAACGPKIDQLQPVPAEGACQVDDVLAADRRASPDDAIACDPDAAAGYGVACSDGDVDACYHRGLCLENEWAALAADDPLKAEAQAALFATYNAACIGKIAEGCLRLGAVVEQAVQEAPARDAELARRRCDAYLNACNLGDEADGCPRCIQHGCTAG